MKRYGYVCYPISLLFHCTFNGKGLNIYDLFTSSFCGIITKAKYPASIFSKSKAYYANTLIDLIAITPADDNKAECVDVFLAICFNDHK